MKRLLIAFALTVATVAPSAHADQIVHGAGWAEGSFSALEHVTVAFERDFSGTYGWGTYVYGDDVLAVAYDCITFTPGAGLGEGVLVASGVVVGGLPLPLLESITVVIDARPGEAYLGALKGVHKQTGDCGASLVKKHLGLTASIGYAPLPA